MGAAPLGAVWRLQDIAAGLYIARVLRHRVATVGSPVPDGAHDAPPACTSGVQLRNLPTCKFDLSGGSCLMTAPPACALRFFFGASPSTTMGWHAIPRLKLGVRFARTGL